MRFERWPEGLGRWLGRGWLVVGPVARACGGGGRLWLILGGWRCRPFLFNFLEGMVCVG